MEISVPNNNITFDASAQTITMNGYYSGVTREQIQHIKNLTTGDTLYNAAFPNKYNISVASGVITHNYDNSNHNDTDIIQVIVVLTETMGYNSTTGTLKITEQSPIDQQGLDSNPALNAVTTAQTSTYVNVFDKKRLTVLVEVTNGGTGGTLKLKTHNSQGTAINVPFIDTADGSRKNSAVCTTGNYVYTLPPNITLKDIAVALESVTDGEFTVDILGGAL